MAKAEKKLFGTPTQEELFKEIIEQELDQAGNLNKSGIAKFVVRTNREVRFWRTALQSRRPKDRSRNDSFAGTFARIQRQQKGRNYVAEILRQRNFDPDLIIEYHRQAEWEFNPNAKKRLEGMNSRGYPEYTSEDVNNNPTTESGAIEAGNSSPAFPRCLFSLTEVVYVNEETN